MKTTDPIRLLAAANPLPAPDAAALDNVTVRDAIRRTIERRRTQQTSAHTSRQRRTRLAILAAAIIAMLAIPALAFSRTLDSLFGLSNPGTAVTTSQLALNDAQILEHDHVDVGAGIVLLATRNNHAFYASRTTDGRTCLLTGPAGGTAPTQIVIGTPCEKDFPSPQQPLLGMYVLVRKAGGPQSVAGLDGLAADGVATVEAIDADGNIILQAPVIDNVYYARLDVQDIQITVPATEIVALNANGNSIYTEAIPQPSFGG